MAEKRDLTVPELLFLNCQSSGLIREDLPLDDVGQPWPMQVSAVLCNSTGSITNLFSHLVKAEGRTAKDAAVAIHGISPWASTQVGVPEPRVLGVLGDMLKTVSAYGMKVVTFSSFDQRVISSAFARFAASQGKPGAYARLWEARTGVEFITLQAPWLTQVCKLPSEFEGGEYRWPSMNEAAMAVLGHPARPDEEVRDSFREVMTLKDLFFALKAKGMFAEAAEQ